MSSLKRANAESSSDDPESLSSSEIKKAKLGSSELQASNFEVFDETTNLNPIPGPSTVHPCDESIESLDEESGKPGMSSPNGSSVDVPKLETQKGDSSLGKSEEDSGELERDQQVDQAAEPVPQPEQAPQQVVEQVDEHQAGPANPRVKRVKLERGVKTAAANGKIL